MAIELKIPSVGESITSATIAEWLKGNGEYVEAGEEIVSIETDKVSQSLEAEVGGILKHIAAEGDELPIGAIVATIEEAERPESAAPAQSDVPVPAKTEKRPLESATPAGSSASSEVRATPLAEKIAREKGVDLLSIEGTGPGGRISKNDVLARVGSGAAPDSPSVPVSAPVPAGEKRVTRRKMSPLRKKIADHLVNAQQDAALLTTFNECDMSSVMEIRKRVQEKFVEANGVKLGFMSFFLKAVVEGLKEVPAINGRIEGGEIVENHFYDVGVAVGTEKGLIVPVVRDVNLKSFADIEKDIGSYANKARQGQIQLSDLQGGVFTVTNGGIYGSLLSTPIINPPQSGILGMHSIQERPVAIEGRVEIRPMMYLALTYDHRIVDGKEAVTFLVKVKECIEAPEAMLMGL